MRCACRRSMHWWLWVLGIHMHAWSTDHELLTCALDLGVAGVEAPEPLPAPDNAPVLRLTTPLSARAADLGREAREFQAQQVLKLATPEGRAARAVVEELAGGVMAIIADAAQRIAPKVCRTQQTNPAGRCTTCPARWRESGGAWGRNSGW